jgi:TRAP-type C4-dicarboxylate transport system permease large subunit
MQLGYLTPPVGLNLFITSYRFKRPIADVYLATLPFLLILLVSVLLITFWPDLSLALLGAE